MKLDDTKISEAIINTYHEKLLDCLHSDAIVIGGGPSGLICSKILADKGYKVVQLERRLFVGGGMWGGGMMFNQVIVQDSAIHFLEEYGINYKEYEEGFYTVDSIECITSLALHAVQAGVRILNNVAMEDLIIKEGKVKGLVINWASVAKEHLMVDPVMIESKVVLDATGHDCCASRKLVEKMGNVLATKSGGVEGEAPMHADQGEQQVYENTKEAYPGLFVSGMAANATFGGQRMGPVFGGMMRSGEKAAKLMAEKIEASK